MDFYRWNRVALFFGLLISSCRLTAGLEWSIQPNSLNPMLLGKSDLTLDCVASGADQIEYAWFHNNEVIDFALEQQISIFPNHSLYISVATNQTLGNYSCHASANSQPQSVIRSQVVDVVEAFNSDAPDLSPFFQSVNEGDTVNLFCLSGESSPAADIAWQADGKEIVDDGVFDIMTSSSGNPLKTTSTLKILSEGALHLNGTKFTCTATNPMNKKLVQLSAESLLIVYEPIKYPYLVVEPPSAVNHAVNTSLTIPCGWEGNPKPRVIWIKSRYRERTNVDVEDVGLGTVDRGEEGLGGGDLFIAKLTPDHEGHYRCVATSIINGANETEEFPVQITYTEFEFEFRVYPQDTTGMAGRSATLECRSPKSRPPAEISWYKDGAPFNLSSAGNGVHPARILPGGDLYFSNVQRADKGSYSCIAQNKFYPGVSRASPRAVLTVKSAPAIVTPPHSVFISKGQLMHLSCQVDGDPFPTVAWYKKLVAPRPGQQPDPIERSYHISFANANQSMVIQRIDYDDTGEYYCAATNIYATAKSPSAKVTVIVPPQITDGASVKVSATVGDDMLIPCRVHGVPSPSVSWTKDGVDFIPRENMEPDNSKGIRVVNITDAEDGQYVCRAVNRGGSRESNITVIVNMPPMAFIELSDHQSVRGQPIGINCHVTGTPNPVVTWLFNGELVEGEDGGPSTSHPEFHFSSNGHSLDIHNAQTSFSGNYTCIATNIAGSTEAIVFLHVKVPPSIAGIRGPRKIGVGQNTSFYCRMKEGDPPPKFTWTKDGAALTPTNDQRILVEDDRVVIKVVQKIDGGLYSCQAVNEAGDDTKGEVIIVQAIPRPPVAIDATPVSTTSVNLTWSPAQQVPGDEVEFWSIQFKLSIEADYKIHADVASGDRSWQEVSELRPGQPYLFRVSAGNEVGISDYSNAISGAPFDSAPEAPSNGRVVSVRKREVQLAWETPSEDKGVIRYYQVDYRREGDRDFVTLKINDPKTPTQTFTLRNLFSYKTYEVRIRGASVKQDHILWGNFTEFFRFTTLKDLPGAAPTNVNVVDTTPPGRPGVVQVTWMPIPAQYENGELLNYVLSFKRQNWAEDSMDVVVPVTQTFVRLEDLLPWRVYQFWVLVENDVGKGNYSTVLIHQTQPSYPTGVVNNVQAKGISTTAIRVSWEPVDMEERNSIIGGYIIDYAERNPPNGTQYEIKLDQADLTYVIKGLKPFTEYNITVQAFTQQIQNGHGPISEPVYVTTQPAPPSPVIDVTLDPNIESIVVRWNPPSHPNGIILHYVVYLWSDAESSDMTDILGPLKSAEKVQTNSANDTVLTLIGLKPNTRYTICIEAENVAGSSNKCEHHSTYTLPAPIVDIVTTPMSASASASTSNDVFDLEDDDGSTTVALSNTPASGIRPPSPKSFLEILNEHIYVVVFVFILMFVVFIILAAYVVQKCVATKRHKRRKRAKYLNAASLMQRQASRPIHQRTSPSLDDSISSASSTLNPRHPVPSYGGAMTYYPSQADPCDGSPSHAGGPMIPSSRSFGNGPQTSSNQEHRNPVFGMKNPRLSESFHGLPIGRNGFSGRAPLAPGEGDAAFDNLAFENDAVVESPRDLRRRTSPTSQRLARGRSLTLQDGSGATVYQHQQMTAPRPDNFQVPETVVTHRNRISRKAAAAIAAERNRQSTVDILGGARDTDYLVDSDMMVVYNERTAL